ncbi:hypothetical protein [Vibrio owensii]|uniref:hypothetical protein n=1 Tax=Vibrio harveyi group TaxID=717610 RepID=UPI003CC54F36
MSKNTVFVVLNDSPTSGAFDWFFEQEPAKKHFDSLKPDAESFPMTQLVLMKLDVEAPLSDRDAVTEEVASHDTDELLENPIECFPYTPEEYKKLLNEYNKVGE